MRSGVRQQRRELRGIGSHLVRQREEIVRVSTVKNEEVEAADREPVRIGVVGAIATRGARIEEAEPAPPTAAAQLVIAAYDDPRRGGEKRRRRIEEVSLPGSPVIAMRAAGTAGASGRATADPVIVIAEMDYEIGPVGGRVRGNRGERPGGRAATILDRTPFEPTAGIADHNDTLHLRRHDRQYRAADGQPRRAGGRRPLANLDRGIRVGP